MDLQCIAGDKLTNCAERDKKALWEAPECKTHPTMSQEVLNLVNYCENYRFLSIGEKRQ